MTILASESRHADTRVVAHSVETRASIDTRIVRTVVRVQQTVTALVATRTLARVAAVSVDTRGSVATGSGGGALVNVDLTSGSLIPEGTRAGELLVVSVR